MREKGSIKGITQVVAVVVPATKPHIRLWLGRWVCTYGNFYEIGSTPAEAYRKLQLSLHTHTGTKP